MALKVDFVGVPRSGPAALSVDFTDLSVVDDLVYHYALGEVGPWPTGPPGSPGRSVSGFALDSSGNSFHGTALNTADGSVVLPTGDPNLPATGVTGPLEGTSGIEFKWYESTSHYYACFLQCPDQTTIEVNDLTSGIHPVGTASTFACWLAFMPPPGGSPSSGIYSLISTHKREFGIGNFGTRIGFSLATGALDYHVGGLNNAVEFDFLTPPCVPGQWFHFVTQIIKLGPALFRRRFYLNATLIHEVVGDANVIVPTYNGAALSFGGGYSNDIWSVHGGGKVAEAAYWSTELTQAQITGLWSGP
jgi:hypothetical protein